MKYYKRINGMGETTTVESYSHIFDIPGAIEITEAEYDSFIADLHPQTTIKRDLEKELDELKATLKAKGIIE